MTFLKVLGAVGALSLVIALGAVPLGQRDAHALEHAHGSSPVTWTCSMHPQVSEDAPGECWICGMDLVPQGKDGDGDGDAVEKRTTKTVHVCPMHPQIVEEEAGTCSICGMDLVEKEIEVEGEPEDPAPPAREILYWVAPMDPNYRSDSPGKSPMGMDLVPVYAGAEKTAGLVEIDPVVVQNMGVRIATARRMTLTRSVRTVGQVIPAEDRLSVVNLRFSGWIEKIFVDETGGKIAAGDPLFAVYSPELLAAQDELLVALRTSGPASGLARAARRRLELLGLRGWQIDMIVKEGKSRPTLTVPAPRDGHVLHKNVLEGAHVKAGTDLYRIADLSTVWVEAEVYEHAAGLIEVGAKVELQLTFQPGEVRTGEVAYVYPTLNERTRTLRVRIELSNEDLSLKPGGFATVSIATPGQPETVVVPTEAVIHSGRRELVFVALSLGRYEARTVRTGLSGDGYQTEILEGLREGERVVVSGQFLLDSESQLKEAVQKMLAARLHARSPEGQVQGIADDDGSKSGGGGYWTCGMHPEVVQEEPGTCPICGMDLTFEEN
ncbi:MAG: efflux RND transporter periplasmic adaptor subunit [Deltaproteobacteria bacterium]|nr:efflux RND transporter periplasmic adaptor subunit [Deltaproteobacteria bacterium]